MPFAIQSVASAGIHSPGPGALGDGRGPARFAADFIEPGPSRIEPLDRAVHEALASCQEKYDRKLQAPKRVNCVARAFNTMTTEICHGAPQKTDCMLAAQREHRLWADDFAAASGFDVQRERAGTSPAGITKNHALRENHKEYRQSAGPAQTHSKLTAFLQREVPAANRGSSEEIVRHINELHKIKWEDQIRMTEAGKLQDRRVLLRQQYTTRPATISGIAYAHAGEHLSRKLGYFLYGEKPKFVERVAQARLKHLAANLADETGAARLLSSAGGPVRTGY